MRKEGGRKEMPVSLSRVGRQLARCTDAVKREYYSNESAYVLCHVQATIYLIKFATWPSWVLVISQSALSVHHPNLPRLTSPSFSHSTHLTITITIKLVPAHPNTYAHQLFPTFPHHGILHRLPVNHFHKHLPDRS